MVKRYELTDAQWRRIEGFVPGKAGDPGRMGANNRRFVNAVLWVLRADGGSGQPVPHARHHPGARPSTGGDRKRGARDQALGRSRGGLTTKIHLAADTEGRPLRILLTPGQAGDVPQAPALLDGFRPAHVLADKAYDSNDFRALVEGAGATAVIPCNPTRKHQIPYDFEIYKARNRIERCFNKLKHFRRIATRYDRQAIYFLAFIHIASAMLWMR